MTSSYAHAAALKALSLIVAEASVAGPGGGYDAMERSAQEALLDIFTRYLRTLGSASRAAAQHAGRSESNLSDVTDGLSALNGASAGELMRFLEEEASEVAFPCNISDFPVPGQPLAAASAAEARPAHVPDFLPPFPDERTYVQTATHNVRPADAPAAKKRRLKHKRQAEDSLLDIGKDVFSAETQPGGAPLDPGPPPLPLPALPAADDLGLAGAAGGGSRDAASCRVPDVLVPGMPAVQQSSARLECSALDAPSTQPSAAAIVRPLSGAAAAAIGNPRQAAILGLKHMHGLDTVDSGEDRGRGSRMGGHASAGED